MDVRTVEAGDTAPGGGTIEIETAIEIGNIFKLGTRYSVPLGATFLDESGTEHPIVMGSYGIGPARIVAASIEQRADEKGIVWPQAVAPWRVHLVALGKEGEAEREAADRLYDELGARGRGIDVIYDDRDAGPGEKLTDAELLGCPVRLLVGRRGLADGIVEATTRADGAEHRLPLESAVEGTLGLLDG
jgi:prolyl-tRNA synthetase